MLLFIDDGDSLTGYDNSLFLGRVERKERGMASVRTELLREYNLPTTRAPEDWPNVHGDLEGRVQRFNDRELRG
jgi:hypothetical protein